MYLFVVATHVTLAVLLILIIILQPGKGGDVASAFGGGGATTVFGPRGPTNLLQRATTIVAVLFMCTSVTLAYYSNQKILANANVEDELLRLQQVEKKAAPPAPAEAPADPVDMPDGEE